MNNKEVLEYIYLNTDNEYIKAHPEMLLKLLQPYEVDGVHEDGEILRLFYERDIYNKKD